MHVSTVQYLSRSLKANCHHELCIDGPRYFFYILLAWLALLVRNKQAVQAKPLLLFVPHVQRRQSTLHKPPETSS